MPVRVVFEQHDDVWIPLFEPRPRVTREILERRAAITGHRAVRRSAAASAAIRSTLTLDACLAAIADAGLAPADIDGLATYPGRAWAARRASRGAGVTEVHDALRLKLDWYSGGIERPGQLGSRDRRLRRGRLRLRDATCSASARSGRARRRARAAARGIGLDGGGGGGGAASAPRAHHGVHAAVPRLLGRELDRDDRAAPLPRVRHHARAAGAGSRSTRAATPPATRRRSTASR